MSGRLEMAKYGFLIFSWSCVGLTDHSQAASAVVINHESRLVAKLVSDYATHGTNTRPVLNASDPVHVSFSVWLIQILEFDIKKQVITSLIWKDYEWMDAFLRWEPSEYEGIDRVFLKPDELWTPDIELYNTIDGKKVEKHEHRVMVWHNGTVGWMPQIIYSSTCPVDVTNFPFDVQVCEMEFGSWSYGESFLNLGLHGPSGFNLDAYAHNVEWKLISTSAIHRSVYYHKFADTYATLKFIMTLRRNSGLWVRLMLLPMILLSVIACVVFWIPPHRPDRTVISMNLFSSFFLLLLLIVQSAPPTTATRLVTCCTLNISMVALAMIMSVINVNLYLGRGDCRAHMIDMVKCMFGRSSKNVTAKAYYPPETIGQAEGSTSASPRAYKKLTNRQRLALTLDTIFFIIFLANLIFVLLIMFTDVF